MQHFDAIVAGVGGVGSAALFHLAARGARVLGLDRFPIAHDRGSSHGQTRLIRQAYFEHPHYVPLLRRAYTLWNELEGRTGEKLYHESGLLQLGSPQGEVLSGVRASALAHDLPIEELSAGEVANRYPGFSVPEGFEAIFERRAGYLMVEQCVAAHAAEAVKLGAVLQTGETILAWRPEGAGAAGTGVFVETDRGQYAADRLILTAGPWAGDLLSGLGIPLEVRRKPLFWFQTRDATYDAARGCPGFVYDLPHGFFYGMPRIDGLGIKVAEHTGGRVVADPLAVDRTLDVTEESRVADFVSKHLPAATGECTEHVVCMYTMTRDSHFIVDRHPEFSQVAFAAGLSGHGFKFAGVLGEALAQLALDGASSLPIAFLSARRPGLIAG